MAGHQLAGPFSSLLWNLILYLLLYHLKKYFIFELLQGSTYLRETETEKVNKIKMDTSDLQATFGLICLQIAASSTLFLHLQL